MFLWLTALSLVCSDWDCTFQMCGHSVDTKFYIVYLEKEMWQPHSPLGDGGKRAPGDLTPLMTPEFWPLYDTVSLDRPMAWSNMTSLTFSDSLSEFLGLFKKNVSCCTVVYLFHWEYCPPLASYWSQLSSGSNIHLEGPGGGGQEQCVHTYAFASGGGGLDYVLPQFPCLVVLIIYFSHQWESKGTSNGLFSSILFPQKPCEIGMKGCE